MPEREQRTLQVAAAVHEMLEALHIPHAVIGAMAMAVHGYQRATEDFGFRASAPPSPGLQDAAQRLREEGFEVELALPDAEDPLGGVITIRSEGSDPIQVVNFLNPLNFREGEPAREAIINATPVESLEYKVVSLEYLVILKLYAGGMASRADALRLLQANPDADLGPLRALADRFQLSGDLEQVLREL